MDALTRMILEEYDEIHDNCLLLEKIVGEKLNDILRRNDVHMTHITHRVKTRDSLEGKLVRKSGKYHSISDLTDIVGFRVICYFSDQVDVAAGLLAQEFVIDGENSVDKRKLIAPNTFGYLSLHYICRLKESDEYPKELCDISFEVQLRSMLQHTWAEIEHDLNYKSQLAVPREIRRDFAKVAGLLEIADSYFLNIKNELSEYETMVKDSIREGKGDALTLNRVTLSEFMDHDPSITKLTEDIAAISGAVLRQVPCEDMLPQLQFFGVDTIADLKEFIRTGSDMAMEMAEKTLRDSEIDELISTVAFYYLFRAHLVADDLYESDIAEFFRISGMKKDRIDRQVKKIMSLKEKG